MKMTIIMKQSLLLLLVLFGFQFGSKAQKFTETFFDSLVTINAKKNRDEQICIALLDSNFSSKNRNVYCPDSIYHDIRGVKRKLFERINANVYQYIVLLIWNRVDILDYTLLSKLFSRKKHQIEYEGNEVWPQVLNGNLNIRNRKGCILYDLFFENGMLSKTGRSYSNDGKLYAVYLFDINYMSQKSSYLEIHPGTNQSAIYYIENDKWRRKKMNDSIVKSLVYPDQESYKITVYCKLKRNFWSYFPPTLLYDGFYSGITASNYGPFDKTWFSELIINDSLFLQITGRSYIKFDHYKDSLQMKVGNKFIKEYNYEYILEDKKEYYFELRYVKTKKAFELIQKEKKVAEEDIISLRNVSYLK